MRTVEVEGEGRKQQGSSPFVLHFISEDRFRLLDIRTQSVLVLMLCAQAVESDGIIFEDAHLLSSQHQK